MLMPSANSAAWLQQQGRDQLTAGAGVSSARWPFFAGAVMTTIYDAIAFLERVDGELRFIRGDGVTHVVVTARGHRIERVVSDAARGVAKINLLTVEICEACDQLDHAIGG